jgi:hypothetical protein
VTMSSLLELVDVRFERRRSGCRVPFGMGSRLLISTHASKNAVPVGWYSSLELLLARRAETMMILNTNRNCVQGPGPRSEK